MKNRVAVFSVDWDDCLVRKNEGDYDTIIDKPKSDEPNEFDLVVNKHIPPKGKTKWQTRLLEDNEALLKYIESVANNYDEIVICPGTARQNPYIDAANSCRDNKYTGSAYQGLEIFLTMLQKRLNKPVTLDRTTTADYFHKRNKGDTFTRSIAWLNTGKEAEDFFEGDPNDRTKVSLHYMYMHKMASEKPNIEIDYYAIDDSYEKKLNINPGIIDSLRDVYSKNNNLIPANTTFITVPYQKGEVLDIAQVKGTGDIDLSYDKTMEEMMVCSMDSQIDRHNERRRLLFDYHACSCWDVFSDTTKKYRFMNSVFKNRKIIPLTSTPSETKIDITAESKISETTPLINRERSIPQPSRGPLFFSYGAAAVSTTGLIGSLMITSESAIVFAAVCSAIPVGGWAVLLAASVGGIAYSYYRIRERPLDSTDDAGHDMENPVRRSSPTV